MKRLISQLGEGSNRLNLDSRAFQVDWLCEKYPEAYPTQLATVQVLVPELKSTTATFRSGKFLERLKCNWLGGEGTRLNGKQKRKVEHLEWFPQWRKDIEQRKGMRQKCLGPLTPIWGSTCERWPFHVFSLKTWAFQRRSETFPGFL